jgi:hypothetical protein
MRALTRTAILSALLPALLAGGAAAPAAAAGGEGFLYGKITTRDGKSYQGRLRWDDEEAFWGDFFNSSKEENRWVDEAPDRERRRGRRTVELFGFELASIDEWHDGDTRQFVSRFGDIARLEPGHGDEVTVTLKSGTRFELEGGSNDVEAKVTVWDSGVGEIGIDWRHIRSIDLMPAPAGLSVAEPRLYGTVKTRSGDFTGYVQWDQEECLGNDELDGETDDGDMSIKMGNIRSIARRSRSSSTVTLKDGRDVVLSDTNDVDSSNRGIYVEDPRYGRVLVGWDAFERVDFRDGGSGPGYHAFAPGQPLAGIVTVAGGRKLTGRLVFDLDESETTEMLDGERRDVEYSIPFALVQTIVPGLDSTRVVLRSGGELQLDDTTDVGEDNAGLLIYEIGKERPTYVPWEDVELIELAAPKKG